ncbi:MAG: CPBP family intramembrane metalloprotease [Planctomycetes bacterium]|nr:CPBP family intramembrane metalloprotease [Planctomycetota bacterium]MBI3835184.1 CPBP family intramembrane metalloprotease [Planctomycetota bacterium]
MIHVTVASILIGLGQSAPPSTIASRIGADRIETTVALPEPLEAIDLGLEVAAFLIVVYAGFEWRRAGRRDPIRHARARSKRLHETDVLLVVVIYMVAALALSALFAIATPSANDARATMIVGNGAHVVGILACMVMASKRFAGGMEEFVLGAPERRLRISALRIGAMCILALVITPHIADATVWIIHQFQPAFKPPAHPTLSALHEIQSPWLNTGLWLGAMIVAPVAEEFFFRGLLQATIINLLQNRWVAIVLASIAFGAVHIGQPHVVPALMFLGVLLGYAYERAGGLIAPILIHALFNLKNLIWDHYGSG